MIFFFTDFGADGLYTGQMEAVIRQQLPLCPVISLLNTAPRGDPRRSAYLLAALSARLPADSLVLAIVDPGVGGEREAVALRADGRWFLGPDNGVLHGVAAQASAAEWFVIPWRPEPLSASFHGRDLFAPIAARIVRGEPDWPRHPVPGPELRGWIADLPEIIYVDHFGNALSGLRYRLAMENRRLVFHDLVIPQANTFCSVPPGSPFWYENSIGLVEIAVNQGRADTLLGPAPLGVVLRWDCCPFP